MEVRGFLSLCLIVLLFSQTVSHGGLSDILIKDYDSVLGSKSDDNATPSVRFDPSRITHLSWHPRAFMYKGFLTDEECDHLIHLAKDNLVRSTVVGDNSASGRISDVRTSTGMFLSRNQDDVVGRIEARIATWTFLPPENGEGLQILHYEIGQKYEPHPDYFNENILGGDRYATVLMYLSDVEKGGETVFPDSEEKMRQPKDDNWSDCAKNGYAVKPRKGDALLFFSLHPNANPDPLSIHGSCPVIEGEKWSATKWIHVRSIEITYDDCVDENELCSEWANVGECQKNPLYMIGSAETRGHCRKSCNVC